MCIYTTECKLANKKKSTKSTNFDHCSIQRTYWYSCALGQNFLGVCLYWSLSFKPTTTCRAAATKWLKLSVQIQISNLFVFVLRELFLAGKARSPTGGTQNEGPFICLRCNLFQPPAVICFVALLCGL